MIPKRLEFSTRSREFLFSNREIKFWRINILSAYIPAMSTHRSSHVYSLGRENNGMYTKRFSNFLWAIHWHASIYCTLCRCNDSDGQSPNWHFLLNQSQSVLHSMSQNTLSHIRSSQFADYLCPSFTVCV